MNENFLRLNITSIIYNVPNFPLLSCSLWKVNVFFLIYSRKTKELFFKLVLMCPCLEIGLEYWVLVFVEGGQLETTCRKPPPWVREPTTHSTRTWQWVWNSNVGRRALSRLSPLRHPCSRKMARCVGVFLEDENARQATWSLHKSILHISGLAISGPCWDFRKHIVLI